MVKGTAGEIEATHLPDCEKYSNLCGRCGMLMNGGGERASHNCIDRLRGTLIKVAQLCSAEGFNIRAAMIPYSYGGYEPEPDLDDLVGFSKPVFEKEIWDNAAVLDACTPVVAPVPASVAAAVGLLP